MFILESWFPLDFPTFRLSDESARTFLREGVKVALILSSFLLVSCAKPPHEIEAIEVTDRNIYSKFDCDILQVLRDKEKDELINLREKQIVKRQNDNARWMWLGVIGGIASPSAQDFEEEIGKSKGKLIAIQSEIDTRCTLDKEEEEEYKEEISHFFYNQSETELDRLLADAAKFYFEEP